MTNAIIIAIVCASVFLSVVVGAILLEKHNKKIEIEKQNQEEEK